MSEAKLEIPYRLRHQDYPIIGKSSLIKDMLVNIAKVASTDATILIYGETGTGKELVANNVHHESRRGSYPFVCVNCPALPAELLESTLFGHEKGAYTNASMKKLGLVDDAEGGTLFLDEVVSLPLDLQSKILRMLQWKELNPVGGRSKYVDVRFIAGTNKRLEEEVKSGRFREDLYYRLNVVTIEIPPLRNRKEDIPELVSYFLNIYSKDHSRVLSIGQDVMDTLQVHDWPGNVRELENLIIRALINFGAEQPYSGDPPSLDKAYVESQIQKAIKISNGESSTITQADTNKTLAEIENEHIIKALKRCKGNKAGAASMLGVSRQSFYYKLRRHNIALDQKPL